MTPDRLEIVAAQKVPPLAVGLRDAARIIGISARNLEARSAAGEVPCVRIGTRRLYRLATLDAWLAAHETATTHTEGEAV